MKPRVTTSAKKTAKPKAAARNVVGEKAESGTEARMGQGKEWEAATSLTSEKTSTRYMRARFRHMRRSATPDGSPNSPMAWRAASPRARQAFPSVARARAPTAANGSDPKSGVEGKSG